jgi:hypothetical protein
LGNNFLLFDIGGGFNFCRSLHSFNVGFPKHGGLASWMGLCFLSNRAQFVQCNDCNVLFGFYWSALCYNEQLRIMGLSDDLTYQQRGLLLLSDVLPTWRKCMAVNKLVRSVGDVAVYLNIGLTILFL